jgi:cytochrome c1
LQPLLAVALTALLAGCAPAPAAPTQSRATKPASKAAPAGELTDEARTGRQLFVNEGCVACHRAPGVPEATGTIGPNLGGIGNPSSRPRIAGVIDNRPDNLKRWLLNPQSVKPGTAMPNVNLTDDQATSLVAFLETLQ